MARIKTVTEEQAQGPARQFVEQIKGNWGYLLGISQVLLPDLQVAQPSFQLYQHLHLRPDSPLTRLQREMVATVVNGLVGGAP
jgi:hypothetical protein